MGYRRYFVIMAYDDHGYDYRGKAPAGRCLIEARDKAGKLGLTVQDLKPEVNYKFYIILNEADKCIGIPAGSVRVDGKGKGELKWEFDADNVGDSGLSLDKFICSAIVVSGKNGFITPLIGYKDQQIQWKSKVVWADREQATSSAVDSAPIPEAVPETPPQAFIEPRHEEPAPVEKNGCTDVHIAVEHAVAEPQDSEPQENRHIRDTPAENAVQAVDTPANDDQNEELAYMSEDHDNAAVAEHEKIVSQESPIQEDEAATATQHEDITQPSPIHEVIPDTTCQCEDSVQEDTIQEDSPIVTEQAEAIAQAASIHDEAPASVVQPDDTAQEHTVQEDMPVTIQAETIAQASSIHEDAPNVNCQPEDIVQADSTQENMTIAAQTGDIIHADTIHDDISDIDEQIEDTVPDSVPQEKIPVTAVQTEDIAEASSMHEDSLTVSRSPEIITEENTSQTSISQKEATDAQESAYIDNPNETQPEISYYKEATDTDAYVEYNDEENLRMIYTEDYSVETVSSGMSEQRESYIMRNIHKNPPPDIAMERYENLPSYKHMDQTDDIPQIFPLEHDMFDEKADMPKNPRAYYAGKSEQYDPHKSFRELIEKFKKEMEELEGYEFPATLESEMQRHEERRDWKTSAMEQIFTNNIQMRPFKRQYRDVKWVRVSMQEPTYLSIDRAVLNSFFIRDAYKQYNHLILGLVAGQEGSFAADQANGFSTAQEGGFAAAHTGKHYILGVPGVYDINNSSISSSLGFVQFKCCDDISPYHGAYGYWLMPVMP